MSRRATIVVALLLASALGTSTLANCMALGAMAPEAQMACCQNGHDKCPMHGSGAESAAQCCKNDSQRQQQLSAAEHQPARISAISIQWMAALDIQPSILLDSDPATVAAPQTAARGLSTPAHLLTTALLI
jgi:hypothetical protein